MTSRLETLDPDLAAELTRLSGTAQRQVSVRVARLAVEHTELAGAVVGHALSRLGRLTDANADLEPALQAVVDDLDRLAFDLRDRVDAGEASHENYEHAFGQARAAAAVAAAFDPDALQAVLETVYEGLAALGSPDAVRPVIAAAQRPR